MPRPENETVYGGVTITENEKEQLEHQPASEYLNFTKTGEDSYKITHRFPEHLARFDDYYDENPKVVSEVRFREAANYYIKGFVKNIVDENGVIDKAKYDDFSEKMRNYIMRPKSHKNDFQMLLGIPDEDIDNFVEACKTETLSSVDWAMGAQIDELIYYQGYLNRYEREKDTMPQIAEPIMKSYKDFKNGLDNLSKIMAMDPKTETEVFLKADCGTTASLFEKSVKELNAYRTRHNLEEIHAQKTDIHMDDMKSDPEHKKVTAFNTHSVFTLDVELMKENGEKVQKFISLETTAPAGPDLFFNPDSGFKGSGIYDVGENGKKYEKLENFHRGNNLVYCKDEDLIIKLKGTGNDGVTRVTGSYRFDKYLTTTTKDYTNNYDELAQKLKDNDSRWIRSSKEFREMKEAFNAIRGLPDSEERDAKIAELKAKAGAYMDYKDPKGNLESEKKLSDYAKARLDLGKEMYRFACGQFNEKEDVRKEIRASILKSIAEEMKESRASNRSELGKEILENPDTFKKFMGDIKNDSTLQHMLKGASLNKLKELKNLPKEDLYRTFKENRLSLQKAHVSPAPHKEAEGPALE